MRRTQIESAAAGARGPRDKGSGGETRPSSPVKCTAFRLVEGAGCPQCRGCGQLASMLTIRTHSVSSRVRRRMSTPRPVCCPGRMQTLTVEIHSVTSRCRREISTPPDSCAPAQPPPSPSGCTGSRVDSAAGYPHCGVRRRYPGGRPAVATMQARVRRPHAGSAGTGVDIAAVGHSKPCAFRW